MYVTFREIQYLRKKFKRPKAPNTRSRDEKFSIRNVTFTKWHWHQIRKWSKKSNQLEDRNKLKWNKEKRLEKDGTGFQSPMGQYHTCGIRSLKKRSVFVGGEGRIEINLKENDYFPNFMNAINAQIQEAQLATNRVSDKQNRTNKNQNHLPNSHQHTA